MRQYYSNVDYCSCEIIFLVDDSKFFMFVTGFFDFLIMMRFKICEEKEKRKTSY